MKRISVRPNQRHKYISKDVYCPPVYFVLRQSKSLFVPPAYVSANDENGERILHTAPSSPLPRAPALPPKQGLCHAIIVQMFVVKPG